MLEGLIEFNAKFSRESIDVVVMEKHTWAFFNCEPNIWIIAAVDNCGYRSPVSHSATHRPNGHGLVAILEVE